MRRINIDINPDLPLFQLTAGQLLEIIIYGTQAKTPIDDPTAKIIDTTGSNRNFVYGLAGIMELFGFRSRTSAQRLKNSGVIDKAIHQCGKRIIVDVDKALELVRESKK
jgi:hypothetical protein